jgi:hypothetical protein
MFLRSRRIEYDKETKIEQKKRIKQADANVREMVGNKTIIQTPLLAERSVGSRPEN